MNEELKRAVLDAIKELWLKSHDMVASETTYGHLRSQGYTIREGELAEIYRHLEFGRVIKYMPSGKHPTAAKTHGGIIIHDVNPVFLGG